MDLKGSIIGTLAFFDCFDYPLTAEEIREYLFRASRTPTLSEVREALGQMEGAVSQVREHYMLKGRERLVDLRKARKFIAEKFWGRVRQYGQYVAAAPFVEMVAVCNNLAYDNASEQSDIDLFIVIKEGRMWLARLWVTLVLQFFGVRRHGDKVAGRFCLSFFATPRKLYMEPLLIQPEDPYLAYWTKLLAPVSGEDTFRRFADLNSAWLARRFGLRFTESSRRQLVFHGKTHWRRFNEWLLGGWFGSLIESTIRSLWKPRTEKKAKALGPEASVVVSDDLLKFHNKDRRKEYAECWKKKVEQALGDLRKFEMEKEKHQPKADPPLAETKIPPLG